MGINSSWAGNSKEDSLFNKAEEEIEDLMVSSVLNKESSLCGLMSQLR